MVKRKENTWQFKVSFALAILMLLLVFGYFTQSFLEIRKVKPGRVAIERIIGASKETDLRPKAVPIVEKRNTEAPEQ